MVKTLLLPRCRGAWAWRLSVLALLFGVVVSGCSRTSGSPHPVDPVLARLTLETVLQDWKEGAELETWRQRHPDVVVQDMDWLAGRELSDFEIVGEGKPVDANLHCAVRLTFADSRQSANAKTVTYLVGTSPQQTVFRQVIP